MQKNRLSNYVLLFSVLTFIAIFFFLVEKSYDNLMKPITSVKQSTLIKPIDPNLDTSTLEIIEGRKYLDQ
jgi:hypothetical protein